MSNLLVVNHRIEFALQDWIAVVEIAAYDVNGVKYRCLVETDVTWVASDVADDRTKAAGLNDMTVDAAAVAADGVVGSHWCSHHYWDPGGGEVWIGHDCPFQSHYK